MGAYDRARERFDKAKGGETIVRERAGSLCQEVVNGKVCGAPLKATEKRRGELVLVEGECSKGHTFSRSGRAAVEGDES